MVNRSRAAPEEREVDLVVQLAHDVRSPITAVVALTGALRDDLQDVVSDQQRHQFNLVYNAALQLEYLMSDLIELARPREDLLELAPSIFSVATILEGVRDLLQPLTELQKSTITTHSTVQPDMRIGQAPVVSRVLLNLAAPVLRNGRQASVTLTSEALDDESVKFEVRCNGPAPDPAVVQKVREVALGLKPRDAHCFSNLGLELSFYLVDLLGSALDVEFAAPDGVTYSLVCKAPPAPDDFVLP